MSGGEGTGGGAALNRETLSVHPSEAARALLGRVLVIPGEGLRARITEVEAYGGPAESPWPDPGAHTWPGPTPRNRVMFGPAGHLYVYFSYGMHWCANVVAGEVGVAGAVLIRAVEPCEGIDEMRLDRPAARKDVDLANGPAKVCQALGIDGTLNGTDLTRPDGEVVILDDGTPPPATPTAGPRVGISVAVDRPWRFSVPAQRHRSRPMPRP